MCTMEWRPLKLSHAGHGILTRTTKATTDFMSKISSSKQLQLTLSIKGKLGLVAQHYESRSCYLVENAHSIRHKETFTS